MTADDREARRTARQMAVLSGILLVVLAAGIWLLAGRAVATLGGVVLALVTMAGTVAATRAVRDRRRRAAAMGLGLVVRGVVAAAVGLWLAAGDSPAAGVFAIAFVGAFLVLFPLEIRLWGRRARRSSSPWVRGEDPPSR